MNLRHILSFLSATLLTCISSHAQRFVDYGPATNFIDIEVHALAGNSMITENYMGCFPTISQMNTSPGASLGIGASAVFGLRNWLGVGTELNLTRNHYRVDVAVASADATSMSNVFLRNAMTYVDIPVYMQFRFNVAPRVRWRVNAGLYYAYGMGGSQQQDMYNAQVNQLGQLVSTAISAKPGYFGNSSTFIHAIRRSDIGVHLATNIEFGRVAIGGRIGLGLKNVAYIPDGRGIVTPNIHNINYAVTLGYRL